MVARLDKATTWARAPKDVYDFDDSVDSVEEYWQDTTKPGDKASTGHKVDNHPMDLGSGFDFGGGHTGPGGSKTKFLQKMPPKQSVHDEPYKFTGDLDRKAYKKEMGRGF